MIEAVLCWVAFLGIGLAAVPITIAVFRFLPDRGYGLARVLGLLIFGYLFWIMGVIRIVPNTQFGAIAVLVLLVVISGVVACRTRESIKSFFKAKWQVVIATEVVFAVTFGVWAYIRSLTPAIAHTEQPMDFALLNAIIQSPNFPPQDPWLAGESISYYYFGYLMSAAVTQVTGFASSVTYNLALVFFAAMSASAIFSVVFNIVSGLRKSISLTVPIATGVVGVVLLLFMGNLVGLLEFFHTNEIGSAGFWGAISINGLDGLSHNNSWHPNEFWWWFRDTRVINSAVGGGPFPGSGVDFTITEFPFFSFLLGDLHPHVMAIPFVILAIGLSYNALRTPSPLDIGWIKRRPWEFVLVTGVIGALGFLNSWDLPTFLGLFFAVVLLRAFHGVATGHRVNFIRVGGLMVLMIVGAFAFFIPFYLFFDSQFAGVTPVRFQGTNPVHLFLALGPLLALALSLASGLAWDSLRDPICSWLRKWIKSRGHGSLTRSDLVLPTIGDGSSIEAAPARGFLNSDWLKLPAFWAIAIPLVPFVIWVGVELGLTVAGVRMGLLDAERSMVEALLAIGSRFGRLLPVFVVMSLLLGVLFHRASREETASAAVQFVVLLLTFGFLLMLGAELFHIEDQFGVTAERMNTVFKFYYQVWILYAIAGSVALYYWGSRITRSHGLRRIGNGAVFGGLGLLLVAGFVYVPSSTYSRAHEFSGDLTLDGMTLVKRHSPHEFSAIQWLDENAEGDSVLIEAVVLDELGQPQGAYNPEVARFSQRTGIPTVLGWGGHERQWRGKPFEAITERGRDVDTFYRTDDEALARGILDKYAVTYVVVGDLERGAYGTQVETRLVSFLDVVFENERVVIYKYRPAS